MYFADFARSNSRQLSYFISRKALTVLDILFLRKRTTFETRETNLSTFRRQIYFEFLLYQPEIRLYLPCSDGFGSKRTFVWIQINRKIVNTIWFRVDLLRLLKDFYVCTFHGQIYFSSFFLNWMEYMTVLTVFYLVFYLFSFQIEWNNRLKFTTREMNLHFADKYISSFLSNWMEYMTVLTVFYLFLRKNTRKIVSNF